MNPLGPLYPVKGKSKVLPCSNLPHRCALLSVDPGEVSGWAIYARGVLQVYGHCDVFGPEVARVIGAFLFECGPHVAAIERPFRVRFGSQTNIGAADRIWRERLKEARVRHIVRVYPSTWRARVLGPGWGSVERKKVRLEEQRVASLAVGATVHPDEAPAILQGRYACFAGEVGQKISPQPKSKKEKSSCSSGSSLGSDEFSGSSSRSTSTTGSKRFSSRSR